MSDRKICRVTETSAENVSSDVTQKGKNKDFGDVRQTKTCDSHLFPTNENLSNEIVGMANNEEHAFQTDGNYKCSDCRSNHMRRNEASKNKHIFKGGSNSSSVATKEIIKKCVFESVSPIDTSFKKQGNILSLQINFLLNSDKSVLEHKNRKVICISSDSDSEEDMPRNLKYLNKKKEIDDMLLNKISNFLDRNDKEIFRKIKKKTSKHANQNEIPENRKGQKRVLDDESAMNLPKKVKTCDNQDILSNNGKNISEKEMNPSKKLKHANTTTDCRYEEQIQSRKRIDLEDEDDCVVIVSEAKTENKNYSKPALKHKTITSSPDKEEKKSRNKSVVQENDDCIAIGSETGKESKKYISQATVKGIITNDEVMPENYDKEQSKCRKANIWQENDDCIVIDSEIKTSENYTKYDLQMDIISSSSNELIKTGNSSSDEVVLKNSNKELENISDWYENDDGVVIISEIKKETENCSKCSLSIELEKKSRKTNNRRRNDDCVIIPSKIKKESEDYTKHEKETACSLKETIDIENSKSDEVIYQNSTDAKQNDQLRSRQLVELIKKKISKKSKEVLVTIPSEIKKMSEKDQIVLKINRSKTNKFSTEAKTIDSDGEQDNSKKPKYERNKTLGISDINEEYVQDILEGDDTIETIVSRISESYIKDILGTKKGKEATEPSEGRCEVKTESVNNLESSEVCLKDNEMEEVMIPPLEVKIEIDEHSLCFRNAKIEQDFSETYQNFDESTILLNSINLDQTSIKPSNESIEHTKTSPKGSAKKMQKKRKKTTENLLNQLLNEEEKRICFSKKKKKKRNKKRTDEFTITISDNSLDESADNQNDSFDSSNTLIKNNESQFSGTESYACINSLFETGKEETDPQYLYSQTKKIHNVDIYLRNSLKPWKTSKDIVPDVTIFPINTQDIIMDEEEQENQNSLEKLNISSHLILNDIDFTDFEQTCETDLQDTSLKGATDALNVRLEEQRVYSEEQELNVFNNNDEIDRSEETSKDSSKQGEPRPNSTKTNEKQEKVEVKEEYTYTNEEGVLLVNENGNVASENVTVEPVKLKYGSEKQIKLETNCDPFTPSMDDKNVHFIESQTNISTSDVERRDNNSEEAKQNKVETVDRDWLKSSIVDENVRTVESQTNVRHHRDVLEERKQAKVEGRCYSNVSIVVENVNSQSIHSIKCAPNTSSFNRNNEPVNAKQGNVEEAEVKQIAVFKPSIVYENVLPAHKNIHEDVSEKEKKQSKVDPSCDDSVKASTVDENAQNIHSIELLPNVSTFNVKPRISNSEVGKHKKIEPKQMGAIVFKNIFSVKRTRKLRPFCFDFDVKQDDTHLKEQNNCEILENKCVDIRKERIMSDGNVHCVHNCDVKRSKFVSNEEKQTTTADIEDSSLAKVFADKNVLSIRRNPSKNNVERELQVEGKTLKKLEAKRRKSVDEKSRKINQKIEKQKKHKLIDKNFNSSHNLYWNGTNERFLSNSPLVVDEHIVSEHVLVDRNGRAKHSNRAWSSELNSSEDKQYSHARWSDILGRNNKVRKQKKEKSRKKGKMKHKITKANSTNSSLTYASSEVILIEKDDEERLSKQSKEGTLFLVKDELILSENESEDEQTYLKQLRASTSKINLIESEIKILENLKVNIFFDVPMLHIIDTKLLNKPNHLEKQQIEELDLRVNPDPFTIHEDDILKKNWKNFCKIHKIKNKPALFLKTTECFHTVLPLLEKEKFVRFLGRYLDDRLLHSIYERFNFLFHQKRKIFTEEDDEILLNYMRWNKGKKRIKKISFILGKDVSCTAQRHSELVSDPVLAENGICSHYFINSYLQKLAEVTRKSVFDLKNEKYLSNKHWKEMSECFHLSELQLRVFWEHTLYDNLFRERWKKKFKPILVNLLYTKRCFYWKDIEWDKIADFFHNMDGPFVCGVFKELMNRKVPKRMHPSLKNSLLHLRKKVYPDMKSLAQILFS